jgi:hypothetical protein
MKINSLLNTADSIKTIKSANSNVVNIRKTIKKRKSKYHLKKRNFDKSKLPLPSVLYTQLGIELKGSGVWRMAKCPFHDDDNPSMGVNIKHGGFICHACGQSGDMLHFYMDYKKVDFITACNELQLLEN